jgi:hypothetical protein
MQPIMIAQPLQSLSPTCRVGGPAGDLKVAPNKASSTPAPDKTSLASPFSLKNRDIRNFHVPKI